MSRLQPLRNYLDEFRKNPRETLFDGNALGGHFVLFWLNFTFVTLLTIATKTKSEYTLLTYLAALVVFPALLLAYASIDKRKEKWQALILTFLPTAVSGGVLGATFADSFFIPKDEREEAIVFTPSIIIASFEAITVLVAYITIGAMSRLLRYEAFIFLDPPPVLRAIVEGLRELRLHVIADSKIIRPFLRLVFFPDTGSLLKGVVEALHESEVELRDEIRQEFKKAGITSELEEKVSQEITKRFPESRKQKLLKLATKEIEDRAAFKFTQGKSTTYRKPRKGGFSGLRR